MNKENKKISIIIPVFNEEESLITLHKEIISVMNIIQYSYEIIFIDDGSTDGTFNLLKNLNGATVISFTRNFGKSQALQAGFDEASGDYIITMDGDLQDDPDEIPNFLKAIDNNDLVCGWKIKRMDPSSKRLPSKLANYVTRKITNISVHDMNCGFKIYRSNVAKKLRLYGDMHRYIPSVVSDLGFKVGEIKINHRSRQYGKTKYGFERFLKSMFDFITLILLRKFTDRPMHLLGFFGGGLFSFGFIILTYLTYIKIFNNALIGDRPLLMLGVLSILLGFQSFSAGFLGELIIRRTGYTKRDFIVREKIYNEKLL